MNYYSILYVVFVFHFRNLSKNPLTSYHSNSHNLASLMIIDVTEINELLLFEENIFSLPNLKEIKGLSRTNECLDCSLTKLHNTLIPKNLKERETIQWIEKSCSYRDISTEPNIVRMAKHNFSYTSCKEDTSLDSCLGSVSNISAVKDVCWKFTQQILTVQYPVGILSMILNFIVILTVVTTKRLRENVSLILTSNLAFGDFSMSLYCVSSAHLVLVTSNEEYYQATCSRCTWIGMFWVLAQVGIVASAILLTLERYLAVVFAMKLHVRLSWNAAAMSILVCWLLGLAFAAYVYVAVDELLHCSYLCFIGNLYPESPAFAVTATFTVPLILLYFLTIPMYIHIYIAAKTASHRAGIKRRESLLAKRIAILVLTNVFLFFLPLGVRAILVLNFDHGDTPFEGSITNDKIGNFLLVVCWNISSCINPFLNAYRNPKLKKGFKLQWITIYDKIRSCLDPNLSQARVIPMDISTTKSQTSKENCPGNPTAASTL